MLAPFALAAADVVSDERTVKPKPSIGRAVDPPESDVPPPKKPGAGGGTTEESEFAEQRKAMQHVRSWSDAQLQALYENIIVDPQDLHEFKVKPQPRLRDLISSDFTRLDLRFFYGFAKKFEVEVSAGSYVPSPYTEGSRSGFGFVTTTARYRWTPDMDPTGTATSGVEVYHPISTVPDGMTDGVNRYNAFLSYARTSTRIKNFQEFFNLSYTAIVESAAPGVIPDDAPKDDFFTAATGVLRNRGPFTYGVSLSWSHVMMHPRADFITVTPSVNIDVPPAYTLNCPGKWQLGVSCAMRHFESEFDAKFRVRVRWIVRLSDITKRWKKRDTPASSP